MSSDVLWGACKPLQCNSTCNNNKRIPKGCDVFEDQEAQLMWDKGSQMDEFFGELYRSFWKEDKTFLP
jgi:hypothetical protein